MELFERWAFYGLYLILPLYLTNSTDIGALGFSQAQKGILLGTFGFVLYFLPVITGAIADRFGYKRILIIAYIILISGYIILGSVKDYLVIWFVMMYVAIGAGLFKPVISATVKKTTTSENSALGFGIFYWVVNFGAFVGPVFASILRQIDWFFAFIISSSVIGINLIIVLLFFKEPETERSAEPLGKTIISILKNVFSALQDSKLLIFLILVAGFWTMYFQLFLSLSNFIDQWMDTTVLFDNISIISVKFANLIGTPEGTIPPELITNLDALYIVLFQLLVSSLIMKYKPINAIISGFLVCSFGIGLWFVSQNPMYLFLSIFIFAAGEMIGSPMVLEYIGKIAPKDKVAL